MKRADAVAAIRGLADGLTSLQIASRLGLQYQMVRRYCREESIETRRGYAKPAGIEERNEKIVAMFKQGVTMQRIGDQFMLTRERVRQVLERAGINASEGGQSRAALHRREKRAARREALALLHYGLPADVVQQLRADGVIRAYRHQKQSACARGIAFTLTFAEWFAVWQTSGKLHLRGRGAGKYVMSRIRDTGGYELGNVHIQLATENSREAVSKWKGKLKANRGVFLLYPGRELAWLAKFGSVRLGFYATEAEAVAAREAYMASNNVMPHVRRGYAICRDHKRGTVRYQVMVGGKYVGSFKTTEEALAARAAYLNATPA